MINNIVLVGRTTKNIELKQNKNGTYYVQFILAVNRPYKDEQGGQHADFITCVAWNKTAETIANYVLKGTMIGIEGRLQVRTYDNEAGIRQYISEVLVNRFTFLQARKSSAASESVEPTCLQQPLEPPSQLHSNQQQTSDYTPTNNYNNPFITATTLAGGLHSNVATISISDDDLPF